jgi:hypothetical protein
MGSEAALIITGLAEVVKLLIMAQNTAVKANMTPEQFKAVADAVNKGFEGKLPEALPER